MCPMHELTLIASNQYVYALTAGGDAGYAWLAANVVIPELRKML